jgi:hypothetical protein
MDKANKTERTSLHENRIPLPFEKAIEGLLSVKPKPKKKAVKKKKKPGKK